MIKQVHDSISVSSFMVPWAFAFSKELFMIVCGYSTTSLASLVTLLTSYGPVVSLASLPGNLNQTFASARRLFALLDEKVKNAIEFTFDEPQKDEK